MDKPAILSLKPVFLDLGIFPINCTTISYLTHPLEVGAVGISLLAVAVLP